jgi:hypothetical protein
MPGLFACELEATPHKRWEAISEAASRHRNVASTRDHVLISTNQSWPELLDSNIHMIRGAHAVQDG